jgi:hypothetical protein
MKKALFSMLLLVSLTALSQRDHYKYGWLIPEIQGQSGWYIGMQIPSVSFNCMTVPSNVKQQGIPKMEKSGMFWGMPVTYRTPSNWIGNVTGIYDSYNGMMINTSIGRVVNGQSERFYGEIMIGYSNILQFNTNDIWPDGVFSIPTATAKIQLFRYFFIQGTYTANFTSNQYENFQPSIGFSGQLFEEN